jgi:hypothetical protein
MSSIIDRILLNETVTREEVESLSDKQKPYAYRLIYDHIPFDKYYVEIDITQANLDHFTDSPAFTEYILYHRNIKGLDPASLREFIENYPISTWFTKDIQESQLFSECAVVKSSFSIYISELYTLHTLRQFPNCWRLLCKNPHSKQSKIKLLENPTQYENDCINYWKFIQIYERFVYKFSKGQRRDASVLAYIMREIITLCDYSDNLRKLKTSLLIKYYAIIGDAENTTQLQFQEFNKLKSLPSFNDLIIALRFSEKYTHIERLILENLDLFYTLSHSYNAETITPTIVKVILNCSKEFREIVELIFNNHFRKLMDRSQKRTIYYQAFIIDSECLLCCKTTDIILKCVSCDKVTCCMKCVLKVDMEKCMLCRSSV